MIIVTVIVGAGVDLSLLVGGLCGGLRDLSTILGNHAVLEAPSCETTSEGRAKERGSKSERSHSQIN